MDPPQRPSQLTARLLPAVAAATGASPNNPVLTLGPGRKDNSGRQPQKLVPPEMLEDFKRAVVGSDMTKAGLIEHLKKTFPKIGKDHIRNSLDLVAHRVGDKRDDKRWVLK